MAQLQAEAEKEVVVGDFVKHWEAVAVEVLHELNLRRRHHPGERSERPNIILKP